MSKGKTSFDSMTDLSYLLDPDNDKNEENDLQDISFGNLNPVKSSRNKIIPVKCKDLVDFKNHPFLVDTSSEDFEKLVDSIRENGIIEPIIVRTYFEDGLASSDKYEIISGHRRRKAAEEAGLDEIPAVIMDITDYEATILMVHENFYREKILPSEKARAYRMCMDAEKHQGVKGVDTAELAGGEEDSRRQVFRYIRLSYLNNELLNAVDDGKLAFMTGVELSYLNQDRQRVLANIIDDLEKYPSSDQAKQIREIEKEESSLDGFYNKIMELMDKKKLASSGGISLKMKVLSNYFPEDTDKDTISAVILKLLEGYKSGRFKDFLNE